MSIYFTEDHEWIKVDGDSGTVGITPYAAGQLGDVVYVELPDVGAEFGKGDEAAVCLLYTSPSPRDGLLSRMPSSA